MGRFIGGMTGDEMGFSSYRIFIYEDAVIKSMLVPDFMLWRIIHGGFWSPRNPKGPGAPDGDGRLVQNWGGTLNPKSDLLGGDAQQ